MTNHREFKKEIRRRDTTFFNCVLCGDRTAVTNNSSLRADLRLHSKRCNACFQQSEKGVERRARKAASIKQTVAALVGMRKRKKEIQGQRIKDGQAGMGKQKNKGRL